MDLELSDEQTWLSEAVGTLLDREWRPAPEAPCGDGRRARHAVAAARRLRRPRGRCDDGLGPVELCLIARALGEHLAPVPYLASAAVRYAVTSSGLPELCGGEDAVALAILEPGSGWARTRRGRRSRTPPSPGARSPSSTLAAAEPARGRRRGARRAGARRGRRRAPPALSAAEQPAFDPTAPMHAVDLGGVAVGEGDVVAGAGAAHAIARLTAIGALLAAAEAVGAAGRLLDDACPLRRRAAPVRPPDRELPGAAPPARRHVRAPGELVVVGAVRRGRARRGRRRGAADGRDRQGLRRARRARGGPRRDAGLRRASRSRPSTRPTASCAGSSCASSSSATPPTTSARSAGRSPPPPSPEPVS